MDNSPNEVIQPAHDPPDARALLELPALRGHPSVLFATRTCPLPPVYRTTGCPMDLSVTGAQSAGAAARPWMSRCASNPLSCPQAHGLARAGWRGLCRRRRPTAARGGDRWARQSPPTPPSPARTSRGVASSAAASNLEHPRHLQVLCHLGVSPSLKRHEMLSKVSSLPRRPRSPFATF